MSKAHQITPMRDEASGSLNGRGRWPPGATLLLSCVSSLILWGFILEGLRMFVRIVEAVAFLAAFSTGLCLLAVGLVWVPMRAWQLVRRPIRGPQR